MSACMHGYADDRPCDRCAPVTADDRLPDADLAAIHLRADAAHPEPWVAQHGVTHDWEEAWWVEDAEGQVLATLPSHGGLNAEFIAHARTDVPRLVAAIRAVEAAARSEAPEEVLSSPETAWVQGYNSAFSDIRAAIRDALEAR